MHIFTSTDKNQQVREQFTTWLDNKKFVWTESGDEIRLFNLSDADLDRVHACADALFGAFTMTCAQPASAPASASNTAPDTLSWYQFTAVLAAVSGKAYKLGELDTPLRWSMDRDTGTFLFQVKRVEFRETTRRYIVTKTELVYTKVYLEGKSWVSDEIRLPIEKAGDLVKFGGVVSPEQYWQRRVDAAAHLDWNQPRLAKELAKKINLSKGA